MESLEENLLKNLTIRRRTSEQNHGDSLGTGATTSSACCLQESLQLQHNTNLNIQRSQSTQRFTNSFNALVSAASGISIASPTASTSIGASANTFNHNNNNNSLVNITTNSTSTSLTAATTTIPELMVTNADTTTTNMICSSSLLTGSADSLLNDREYRNLRFGQIVTSLTTTATAITSTTLITTISSTIANLAISTTICSVVMSVNPTISTVIAAIMSGTNPTQSLVRIPIASTAATRTFVDSNREEYEREELGMSNIRIPIEMSGNSYRDLEQLLHPSVLSSREHTLNLVDSDDDDDDDDNFVAETRSVDISEDDFMVDPDADVGEDDDEPFCQMIEINPHVDAINYNNINNNNNDIGNDDDNNNDDEEEDEMEHVDDDQEKHCSRIHETDDSDDDDEDTESELSINAVNQNDRNPSHHTNDDEGSTHENEHVYNNDNDNENIVNADNMPTDEREHSSNQQSRNNASVNDEIDDDDDLDVETAVEAHLGPLSLVSHVRRIYGHLDNDDENEVDRHIALARYQRCGHLYSCNCYSTIPYNSHTMSDNVVENDDDNQHVYINNHDNDSVGNEEHNDNSNENRNEYMLNVLSLWNDINSTPRSPGDNGDGAEKNAIDENESENKESSIEDNNIDELVHSAAESCNRRHIFITPEELEDRHILALLNNAQNIIIERDEDINPIVLESLSSTQDTWGGVEEELVQDQISAKIFESSNELKQHCRKDDDADVTDVAESSTSSSSVRSKRNNYLKCSDPKHSHVYIPNNVNRSEQLEIEHIQMQVRVELLAEEQGVELPELPSPPPGDAPMDDEDDYDDECAAACFVEEEDFLLDHQLEEWTTEEEEETVGEVVEEVVAEINSLEVAEWSGVKLPLNVPFTQYESVWKSLLTQHNIKCEYHQLLSDFFKTLVLPRIYMDTQTPAVCFCIKCYGRESSRLRGWAYFKLNTGIVNKRAETSVAQLESSYGEWLPLYYITSVDNVRRILDLGRLLPHDVYKRSDRLSFDPDMGCKEEPSRRVELHVSPNAKTVQSCAYKPKVLLFGAQKYRIYTAFEVYVRRQALRRITQSSTDIDDAQQSNKPPLTIAAELERVQQDLTALLAHICEIDCAQNHLEEAENQINPSRQINDRSLYDRSRNGTINQNSVDSEHSISTDINDLRRTLATYFQDMEDEIESQPSWVRVPPNDDTEEQFAINRRQEIKTLEEEHISGLKVDLSGIPVTNSNNIHIESEEEIDISSELSPTHSGSHTTYESACNSPSTQHQQSALNAAAIAAAAVQGPRLKERIWFTKEAGACIITGLMFKLECVLSETKSRSFLATHQNIVSTESENNVAHVVTPIVIDAKTTALTSGNFTIPGTVANARRGRSRSRSTRQPFSQHFCSFYSRRRRPLRQHGKPHAEENSVVSNQLRPKQRQRSHRSSKHKRNSAKPTIPAEE